MSKEEDPTIKVNSENISRQPSTYETYSKEVEIMVDELFKQQNREMIEKLHTINSWKGLKNNEQ